VKIRDNHSEVEENTNDRLFEEREIPISSETFTWDTDIKSRNCFLLVLEFTNLSRKKLEHLTACLSRAGKSFFNKYIKNNSAFKHNIFNESNWFSLIPDTPNNMCDWVPSEETLKNMSMEELQKTRIDKIRYDDQAENICCLTFEFNNGTRVPPEGTYTNPCRRRFYLSGTDISELHFEFDKYDCFVSLSWLEHNSSIAKKLRG